VALAGRAAAALVPWFTVWAYSRGGVALILEAFCGLLLFQGLAVILFGINTENRSLEELAPEAGVDQMLAPGILEA
jgi:putative MFS transporter